MCKFCFFVINNKDAGKMASSLDLDFIKSAMKSKRITQAFLAEKLGLTQSCIGNYFSGRTDPPISTLVGMARELGCSLNALLLEKPPTESAQISPHTESDGIKPESLLLQIRNTLDESRFTPKEKLLLIADLLGESQKETTRRALDVATFCIFTGIANSGLDGLAVKRLIESIETAFRKQHEKASSESDDETKTTIEAFSRGKFFAFRELYALFHADGE